MGWSYRWRARESEHRKPYPEMIHQVAAATAAHASTHVTEPPCDSIFHVHYQLYLVGECISGGKKMASVNIAYADIRMERSTSNNTMAFRNIYFKPKGAGSA